MIKILRGRRGGGVIERLRAENYQSAEERDRLLSLLAADPDVTLADVAWMVGARDPAVRGMGARLVKRLNDPRTVEHFVRIWPDLAAGVRQAVARSMADLAPQGWERNLEEQLGHRNPKYRAAAQEMLQACTLTPGIRRLLARQLEADDEGSRKEALVRLLEDPAEANLDQLSAYLTDPDEELRLRVVRAIGARPDRRFLDLLAGRLEVESYAVQQELIKVLLEYARAGHDVTSHVLPLLSGGDGGLRQTAMKLLTHMPDRKRVVREFIAYSKSLSGWVRQRALETMAGFGEALFESALELFGDPDPTVRASAIHLAASVGSGERLEGALIEVLRDPDWWVRVNAAETLGEMKSRAAVPHLMALLRDPDSRWSALDSLAMIRHPASLPEIARLLEEEDADVRSAAVKVLAKFGLPEILAPLKRICSDDPSLEVRSDAYEAVRSVGASVGLTDQEEAALRRRVDLGVETDDLDQPPVARLLVAVRERGASDIHITVGQAPLMRVRGDLVALEDHPPLDAATTQALLRPLLSAAHLERLATRGSVELCHAIADRGRYRGSVFVDQKGLNAVFRVIPNKVPNLVDIGLPAHVSQMATWHQGLVLIVGPAGSGKTTTLAALVNLVNDTRQAHVITIEDPIEYVHHFKRSLINQRQIGRDTVNVQRALRAALREDPDVIVLGEMRDSQTVKMALEAAETGHLVIATMNGTSALRAVDRIINSFPPEEQSQVRMMLSDTLKLVIGQGLLPRADGEGRVAVFEILVGLPTVAAVIREGKTVMLTSIVQTGRQLGMRSHDDALMELVQQSRVTPELAYQRAHDKRSFEALVPPEFLEESWA